MRRQCRVLFRGTVQGVGFRYMTERLARRHPVTGFVRNLEDGRVEVVAEGEEDDLKHFLAEIRASQLGAYIREAKAEWSEASGQFSHFEIAF